MLGLESFGRVAASHAADAQLMDTAITDFLGVERNYWLGHMARTVYTGMLSSSGKNCFVDKTPRYHLCLDFLAEALPDARFLWIKRNPLDVAASVQNAWDVDVSDLISRGEDHTHIFDFVLGLPALLRFSKTHRVFSLRYEDLVARPSSVLRDVFDNLKLDPAGVQDPLDRITLPEQPWRFGDQKIFGTTAVHQNSVDVFSEALRPEQIGTIASALGPTLFRDLGYADVWHSVEALTGGPVPDRSAEIRAAAARQLEARRLRGRL